MPRTFVNSQRAFPLALIMTLAFALSPWNGVTNVLAEVFRIVLMPFTDLGNRLASSFRSAPSSPALAVRSDGNYVEELKQLALENERLYLVEREKAKSLQQTIDQLQRNVSLMHDLTHPVRLQVARVGMRSPLDSLGEVMLNVGANVGVIPDTVAVYDAVHLIGRVSQVSPYQSTLIALASKNTRRLAARIFAKDRKQTDAENGIVVDLAPRGDGTFIGAIERMDVVNPGDDVMLFDSSWPESAQGLHVGYVDEVKPNDMQPLRNTVIVRPAFQVSQVSQVVLRIEVPEGQQPSVIAGVDHP